MPIEQWLQGVACVVALIGLSIIILIVGCAAAAKEVRDDVD